MPSLEALAQFWSHEGLNHVIPNTGTEFPEGFDIFEILGKLIEPGKNILEVGCGYGRLCRGFAPDKYVGVDVNPNAIAKARANNPEYRFEQIAPAAELPKADVALIYTVGLHISDEELPRFLAPICAAAPAIVIAEIMDRRWRRPGNPPVFNRDPEQYILEMANKGYLLRRFGKAIYKRYDTPEWNVNRDVRQTFHYYQKAAG